MFRLALSHSVIDSVRSCCRKQECTIGAACAIIGGHLNTTDVGLKLRLDRFRRANILRIEYDVVRLEWGTHGDMCTKFGCEHAMIATGKGEKHDPQLYRY